MPTGRQQPIHPRKLTPYHSIPCRIGTHSQCDEMETATGPSALPVIYEACACQCHRSSIQSGGDSQQ